MAVSVVASSSASSGSGTVPAGTQADDVMVAFVNSTGAQSTPAGWTQLHEQTYFFSSGRLGVYLKVAVGGDANPTWTGGSVTSSKIISFRGVDTATPVEDSDVRDAGSDTTPDSPAITVSTDGCGLAVGVGTISGSVTYTAPGGMTEEQDSASSALFSEILGTAPGSITRTPTASGSGPHAIGIVALKAAAGGGGDDPATGRKTLLGVGA